MTRAIGLFLLCLLLPGCQSCERKPPVPQTITIYESVPYECGTPPAVDAYEAREVRWTVESLSDGSKVFALVADMYGALMSNMVDAAASAKQLSAQRDFYVDCIERSKTEAGDRRREQEAGELQGRGVPAGQR